MSPQEFAKAIGVSRQTVYRWLQSGRIKTAIRKGPSRIEIPDEELQNMQSPYLKDVPSPTSNPPSVDDKLKKIDDLLSSVNLSGIGSVENADQNTETETANVTAEDGGDRDVPDTAETDKHS